MIVDADLTQGPVRTHLLRIAVPYAVGMVFVILFGWVDAFFAGLLSTDALAALAISFPIFFVLMAIGMGINAAVVALVGNALGTRDPVQAKQISSQGISYALVVSIILAVAGFLVVPSLVSAISGDTEVFPLAVEYLNVLLLSLPAFLLFSCANGILLAQGNAVTVMHAHIANLVANIILTPPMVFGIPSVYEGLGFTGIALSTLVAQTGVTLYVLRVAYRSKVWMEGEAAVYRPRAHVFRELTAHALPAGIALGLMIFSGYIIQFFLKDFGTHMIAAFGIAIRIEQLVVLPGMALAYSLRPVVSQNFGAGEYDRIREATSLCYKYGTVLMVGAAVVIISGSRIAMGWFTEDSEVIDAGMEVLLVIGVLMPFVFIVLAVISFLQGLKRPAWVLVLILYERLCSPVVYCAVFVLVLNLGVWGVWSGLAASVVTGWLLALAVARRVSRQELGSKSSQPPTP